MGDLSPFAQSIFQRTYQFNPTETWEGCAHRVAHAVANDQKQEEKFFQLIRDRIFIPGGRYLYTAGRKLQQFNNCMGFLAEDSREGWASLLHDVTMCLSMGGGLGVNYSGIRASGAPIDRMGGTASGPIALMSMVNEIARHVMAGGRRRSALWAGLNWNHADAQAFVDTKSWNDDIKTMKKKNFEYPAPLDQTNISVIIGDDYLANLKTDASTQRLHMNICENMLKTGEPGFLNMSLRLKDDPFAVCTNACTEAQLHQHDVCNLMSIVLPRIKSLDHMEEVTRQAIRFLINGSIKADYPTEKIAKVAKHNRRIGLGVMGLHEFMLINNHKYEWFDKLERYLQVWKDVSDDEAEQCATSLLEATPINKRAIAPTGTISIIASTTSGIEPIFCSAYKRRYLDGGKTMFQYVIDPTAKRLIDMGIPSKEIEDSYQLSYDVRRRLEVNAQIQTYVDQAISSTINLPEWGTDSNCNVDSFSALMTEYLPRLKGLTTYPQNSRVGQPLSPISVEEALGQEGVVYEETGECQGGVCGL